MADYIEAAIREARYEVLEDGTWYAEIPGLKGVWSDAETREQSRKELEEVLEEWIYAALPKPADTSHGRSRYQGAFHGLMPPFGPVSRRDLIRYLRMLGFEGPYPGTRHEFMVKGDLTPRLPNPHRGEISRDLLDRVLKQAGVSKEEWRKL